MSDDWADYTAAARRLTQRRAEHRAGGRRRASEVAGWRREIDTLTGELVDQQAELLRVARRLQLAPPTLRGGPVGDSAPDGMPVPDRLRRVRQRLAEADEAVAEAERLAGRPPLLPNASPHLRNAVVYGGWAVVCLLAQLVMVGLHSRRVVADTFTVDAWACCGFPMLAFFAGYLTIGFVCRPRGSTGPVPRSPRLGLVVCAASLPLYAVAAGSLGALPSLLP